MERYNDNGGKIGRKSAINLDVYEEIALFREHLAVDGFIFGGQREVGHVSGLDWGKARLQRKGGGGAIEYSFFHYSTISLRYSVCIWIFPFRDMMFN